ncbi:Metallo-dependent phosphatase-like protein [Xylaria castorea]|nr:Metallo-dependent phosphatase-like protein [Xylaria castorea]
MARRSTASDGSDTADITDNAKPDAIRTRLPIMSDTHAAAGAANTSPVIEATLGADVAIHCGDLTQESKLADFQIDINLLRSISAPLKLVIAGNHDFTLDLPVFRNKVEEACRLQSIEQQLIARATTVNMARDAGILFLDEGNYDFHLENGALLKVYASPFTPSLGDWGFRYAPQQGHCFTIEDVTHLVITPGPPLGICDYVRNPGAPPRAGCGSLFAAHGKRTAGEGDGCVITKHGLRDSLPLHHGKQTLYVNAAIEDPSPSHSPRFPWLVELELRRHTTEHATALDLAPN